MQDHLYIQVQDGRQDPSRSTRYSASCRPAPFLQVRPQSIQSARLSFLSSELDPFQFHPLVRKGVLLLPPLGPKGKRRTRLWGRGWGPNSDEGTDTLLLYECVDYNPSTVQTEANK
jgi:hypothetical protein